MDVHLFPDELLHRNISDKRESRDGARVRSIDFTSESSFLAGDWAVDEAWVLCATAESNLCTDGMAHSMEQ